MQLFGQNNNSYPFAMFSISHLVMILLFLIGCYLLYLGRHKLAEKKNGITVLFLSLLLLSEGSYHYWLVKGEQWDISFALPLHLCSISVLLCILLLIFHHASLFQLTYYIGIAGATMAILTPDLFFGYPHFRFFQFFIIHIIIVWTTLFYIFSMKFRPTLKGLITAFIALNFFASIALIVNHLTGGNYMFLSRKPANGSILDMFGPYPNYIFILEVVALFLFVLMFLPFKHRRKDLLKKKKSTV